MLAARAVRVRYAPSPTGSLHLGGLRTALFNFLFARQRQGRFLVRIEDTDQKRLVPGSALQLQALLGEYGIAADEPVQAQSSRLDLYQRHASALLDGGHAYRCFCSAERLAAVRARQGKHGQHSAYDGRCRGVGADEALARAAAGEAHTVRMRAPRTGTTTVEDLVRGSVVFDNRQMDDQIVVKSDGFPTYHLASVVDDHDMDVSHVIRGEEWVSSTPKHLTLYEMLGWRPPVFVHLPLLLNADRSKLSKRNDDASAHDFVHVHGYEPSAVLNFVALLGWTPKAGGAAASEDIGGEEKDSLVGGGKAKAKPTATATATNAFADPDSEEDLRQRVVFPTMAELVEAFDVADVTKKGAIVDMDFMHWLNGEHLRSKPPADLVRSVRDAFPELASGFGDDFLTAVTQLLVPRAFRRRDLVSRAETFLIPCGEDLHGWTAERDELLLGKGGGQGSTDSTGSTGSDPQIPNDDRQRLAHVLGAAADDLEALGTWDEASIRAALKGLPKRASQRESWEGKKKLKAKDVMMPVRWAATGSLVGPSLPAVIRLIDQPRTVSRIRRCLQLLSISEN